jgi:fatty-acyl-CoA synthase
VTPQLHDPPLFPHLVIRSLAQHGDRPCLYLGGRTITYADVQRRTSQMLQAQRSKGIGLGTRVAVLSKNRPDVLTNLTASLVNGCVLTPLHPMGSLADHSYAVEDAEIECLVFDANHFTTRAAELRERFPHLTLLGFGPNDAGDDYLALADGFEPGPLEPPDITADDLCTIVYTGGTTGRPKGVLMPHRVWQAMTWIQMSEWEFPDEIRIAVPTPLSHAALSLVAPVMLSGGAFYVMETFTPDGFFDLVEEHRITTTLIVPVMLYALQAHERYATADMSSMETIFYGASPMSPAKLAEAIEHWGPIFFQFYGQTEAPMVITHLKKGQHDPADLERLSSCGRPVPWMHVALLDTADRPVGHGESGEICTRGPLVMTGYKDRPDETAEALSGGWLHTGDVGRFDDDGYLYIVDRTKDMVITGGFNVFPREVEDVISTHPAVNMVMVIGVPDPKWGEAVKAVVVLQPGQEASDELTTELQQLVRAEKGPQQSPKSIDYVSELPVTAVGKPDKKAVRARYWTDTDRAVG